MMRSSLLSLAVAMSLTACADPTSGTMAAPDAPAASRLSGNGGSSASENQDLATLRASTARFHRFEVARDAGYTYLFMNMCMADQSPNKLGAMGLHYVNTDSLDDHVNVASPEAIMYEPEANGQLRLVGVEYVIPAAAWTSTTPPQLFGKSFKLNAFNLWALHVWVWKDNPSGLYADWNPNVSCANAS